MEMTQHYLVEAKVHGTNRSESRTTSCEEKKTSQTTGHGGQPARAQTLPTITSTEYSITLVIPTWPSPTPDFKAHCLN